jgi:hypothetical protein
MKRKDVRESEKHRNKSIRIHKENSEYFKHRRLCTTLSRFQLQFITRQFYLYCKLLESKYNSDSRRVLLLQDDDGRLMNVSTQLIVAHESVTWGVAAHFGIHSITAVMAAPGKE